MKFVSTALRRSKILNVVVNERSFAQSAVNTMGFAGGCGIYIFSGGKVIMSVATEIQQHASRTAADYWET